jgi:hypothetical protein
MNGADRGLWASKGNIFWITLAVLLLTTHIVVKHLMPAFNPPATLDKPYWMRAALYGELLVHIFVFGAAITGIRNRIPSLKRPSYSDDGTLSIGSSQPSISENTRWGEIASILLEFLIYLAAWAWVYGIV